MDGTSFAINILALGARITREEREKLLSLSVDSEERSIFFCDLMQKYTDICVK